MPSAASPEYLARAGEDDGHGTGGPRERRFHAVARDEEPVLPVHRADRDHHRDQDEPGTDRAEEPEEDQDTTASLAEPRRESEELPGRKPSDSMNPPVPPRPWPPNHPNSF